MSAPGAAAGSSGGDGGLAGGDGGEAQNGRQNVADGQQGAPDFGALSQQLEQLAGGQEELRAFLAAHPALGQAEGVGDDGDDFDLDGDALEGFDDESLDGEPGDHDVLGDPQQLAEQIAESFDRATAEAFAEHVAPIAQALAETRNELEGFRNETEFKELLAEFPEIGENAAFWVPATAQWAQAAGLPDHARSPHLMRVLYLASKTAQIAEMEAARKDPVPAQLEGGGGANPGSQQPTAADRILNPGGKRGASVLNF